MRVCRAAHVYIIFFPSPTIEAEPMQHPVAAPCVGSPMGSLPPGGKGFAHNGKTSGGLWLHVHTALTLRVLGRVGTGLGMSRQGVRQVCGRFEKRNFSYKFLSALSYGWTFCSTAKKLCVRMSGVKQGCVRFDPTKNITFGSAASPRPCGAGCLTPPTKTKPSVRHLLHQQQK